MQTLNVDDSVLNSCLFDHLFDGVGDVGDLKLFLSLKFQNFMIDHSNKNDKFQMTNPKYQTGLKFQIQNSQPQFF